MATQHSQDLQFPLNKLRQSMPNLPDTREISQAVRIMYRLGYAAKGLVFLISGALALMLTLGMGGQLSDSTDVLQFVNRQPFGQFLLLLMGVSLLGFVLWRMAQSIFNVEHQPRNAKNIVKRIGYAISGLSYFSLSVLALRGFMEGRVQPTGAKSTALTAKLMEMPAGTWLVMAIGAIIIGVGLFQVYLGLSKRFMQEYESGRMTAKEAKVIKTAGMIGLPARGFTFVILGFFFIQAGLYANAAKTKSTKGVLEFIIGLPFGQTILQIVAAGFIGYAIYCFAAARFKRFA